MAGSNGSSGHRGQAPQHWPPESEEQARALEYARWQQQQAQAQQAQQAQAQGGYAPAPGQHYPQDPYPAQGDPHAGYAQPGYQQAPQYAPAPGQHGYAEPTPRSPHAHAPQFERFAAGAPPSARDAYGRYEPAALPVADPNALPPGYDPHGHGQHGYEPAPVPPHDPRYPSYAQGTAPAPGHPGAYPGTPEYDPRHGQARAEVQSWDLSNYAPGQMPPGYAAQAGQPPLAHGMHGGHDAHWQQPPAGQWQQPPGGHQGYDPAAAGHFQQHAPRPGEPGFQPGGAPHDDGFEGDEAPQEERRRGPGTMVIVGALVGAIAVGGGLAYGYKMLGGGARDKGKPPVVKAEANPARTVPKDAGGKTIEHSDKKVLNRLANDAPVPTTLASGEPRGNDVDGGAKKVQSIPITLNRDGTLSPQVQAPANSGVPGLLIDGLGPPPGAQPGPPLRGATGPQPQPQPQTAPPAPRVVSAPAAPQPPAAAVKTVNASPPAAAAKAPKVADLPLPKVIQPPPPAPAEPKGPAVARTPVPKKAAGRDDLLSAKSGAGAASAAPAAEGAVRKGSVVATGASGYVAVLASKKSRQDALNSFADLHSQYPDLLGGMTPDVREANLADKGVWYRLIVGPPGSQQAARALCVKLKERGMKDCWPVAY